MITSDYVLVHNVKLVYNIEFRLITKIVINHHHSTNT